MGTYKTYQECKIANPECEVVTTAPNWDADEECIGTFEALVRGEKGAHFLDDETAWVICNPSDHCITVKEFLDAGYRFEVGDLWLDYDGDVMKVEKVGLVNVNEPHELDNERYVLRSAAMGWIKRADDADREALSRIGAQLSTIHLNKKPRAKVEHVKVNGNNEGGAFWECAKDYSEGVIFTTMGSSEQLIVDSIDDLLDRYKCHNLYRRIETPMTEREAFIEEAVSELENGMSDRDYAKALFDSGKFKLVN